MNTTLFNKIYAYQENFRKTPMHLQKSLEQPLGNILLQCEKIQNSQEDSDVCYYVPFHNFKSSLLALSNKLSGAGLENFKIIFEPIKLFLEEIAPIMQRHSEDKKYMQSLNSYLDVIETFVSKNAFEATREDIDQYLNLQTLVDLVKEFDQTHEVPLIDTPEYLLEGF